MRSASIFSPQASSSGGVEAIERALSRAERLTSLKSRLSGEARASPLFDIAAYTRRFEDGVLRIWGQREAR